MQRLRFSHRVRVSLLSSPATLLALSIFGANAILSVQAQEQPSRTNQPGDFDPHPGAPSAVVRGESARAHSLRDEQGHWTPTDFAAANSRLPTLVITGDSTASTGDPAHRGWGAVLTDFFDTNQVNVINRARGGRSFRTFYGEGSWQQVVDALRPGDFVVIEFGHNDGGKVTDSKGRADLPGTGDEIQNVTRPDGTTETVHTYGWYLRKFIRDVKAKGATPIVTSTTVRNIWRNGKVERGMGHMLEWAKRVAGEEKAPFVDHSDITADRYEQMGEADVAKFFPADHTHTSTAGAVLNAETFIAGLKALPEMPLVDFLNARGRAIKAYQRVSISD